MHDSRRATPEGRNDYRYRRWWPEEAGDLLEATVDCKLPDIQALRYRHTLRVQQPSGGVDDHPVVMPDTATSPNPPL